MRVIERACNIFHKGPSSTDTLNTHCNILTPISSTHHPKSTSYLNHILLINYICLHYDKKLSEKMLAYEKKINMISGENWIHFSHSHLKFSMLKNIICSHTVQDKFSFISHSHYMVLHGMWKKSEVQEIRIQSNAMTMLLEQLYECKNTIEEKGRNCTLMLWYVNGATLYKYGAKSWGKEI